jgi:hypothetical protein
MTEAEWLACTDPTPMLEFLRGKASDRKLRLFACACARRVWLRWEAATKVPHSVEVSEQFADGEVSQRKMRRVQSRLGARGGVSAAWAANCCEFAVLEESAETAAARAVGSALDFAYHEVYEQTFSRSTYRGDERLAAEAREIERRAMPPLLREVFGKLLATDTLNRDHLAGNNATVARLGRTIYADRAFDRLPILADALEDAGCDNADILAHCRGPGPHVRGCWVVDLILGKE